jgi:hypothetical protein
MIHHQANNKYAENLRLQSRLCLRVYHCRILSYFYFYLNISMSRALTHTSAKSSAVRSILCTLQNMHRKYYELLTKFINIHK